MMPRYRWVALVVSAVLGPAAIGASPDSGRGPIVPRDALRLARSRRAERWLVHIDPIEARIVAGTWQPPVAGAALDLPDGKRATWEAIRADEHGGFGDRAPAGSYVSLSVPLEEERILRLEAAGHAIVYINGEPRVGDPYGHGYVRLPVKLKRGANELLFQAGRESLRVRLEPPGSDAEIDGSDTTLPDLLIGQDVDAWGAVVIRNATERIAEGLIIRATLAGGRATDSRVPALPPLGVRKVGFRLLGPPPAVAGSCDVRLELARAGGSAPLDSAKISLRTRRPDQTHKRTFQSEIDGSIQYFGVVPPAGAAFASTGPPRPPGLLLTLHGAGVEAIGQAEVYAPKPGLLIVAPTNRRTFGFDWEDWGRLDALEVLDRAQRTFGTNLQRTYLTGHSMGGHGTWILGLSYPDRFAAIAPSAGWVSMASYAGARQPQESTPVAKILRRATAPSDTLAVVPNSANQGVYVLHGDADDNVPVGQARTMRRLLADFHPDFAYFEQRGAGHWWGSSCCDWPPLIDFLSRHELPTPAQVSRIDFRTVSPGISSRFHWAEILAQDQLLEPSRIQLNADASSRRIAGTTANVARLALNVDHLSRDGPLNVELDGKTPGQVAWPGVASPLRLERRGESWFVMQRPSASLKGPGRYGPFKDAFRNRFQLVYGTCGTPEENAWSLAKARLDAETFWYRGNGDCDVLADREFNPAADPERSVVLYGNADTNAAWDALMGGSPIRVRRGLITVGDREERDGDSCCLFIRPRPNSDTASVAVVSGTGISGMRLTDRLPYFVSGAGFPDWLIARTAILADGTAGLRAAGFFGPDWDVRSGQSAWSDISAATRTAGAAR
jgi:poly(3-hydroxybutyrate) depolymerase